MKSKWTASGVLGMTRVARAMMVLLCLVVSLAGSGCGSEADDGLSEEGPPVEESSASLLSGLTVTPSTPVAGSTRDEVTAKLTLSGRSATLQFIQRDSAALISATRISLNLTCQSGGTLLTKSKRFPDITFTKVSVPMTLSCPFGTLTRAVANFAL